MRYPLANSYFKRALFIFTFFTIGLSASIPERPSPPKLVNDLASILSEHEREQLERRLLLFDDTTSNQVVIVTLPSIESDRASTAYQIGESWGVGDSRFNNGVVILVVPKRGNQSGEVFIATGYGLEGVLPDALCRRVIEYEMIPHFKNEEYYKGLVSALDVILPIASGEYSYKEYRQEDGAAEAIAALVVLVLVALFVVFALSNKNGGGTTHIGGGGKKGPSALDLLLLGSMLSGGRGRSSGGMGSGGFGGFGGGSFGGGGAGGSW